MTRRQDTPAAARTTASSFPPKRGAFCRPWTAALLPVLAGVLHSAEPFAMPVDASAEGLIFAAPDKPAVSMGLRIDVLRDNKASGDFVHFPALPGSGGCSSLLEPVAGQEKAKDVADGWLWSVTPRVTGGFRVFFEHRKSGRISMGDFTVTHESLVAGSVLRVENLKFSLTVTEPQWR
jgi:hypothetical protein